MCHTNKNAKQSLAFLVKYGWGSWTRSNDIVADQNLLSQKPILIKMAGVAGLEATT
jgi:hypothetical protein